MRYSLETVKKECFGLGNYACNDTKDNNGRIFIPVSAADGAYALYSEDNGESFRRLDNMKGRPNVPFIRLSDGTFFALSFDNAAYESLYDKNQDIIPYIAAVYRAETMDDVINGKIQTSYAQIDIPDLSCGFGDSGNGFAGCVNSYLQLSNGDILAMMYGQFKSDTTLCPYFEKYGNYKFYLYRVWTAVSHDLGKTWEFGTTVADCQTYPIADINAEGYCEPCCIETSSGHLCAILRTGGHEVVSPLYCSHSDDMGKTWSEPYEICSWGVLPKIMRMQDGTLVVASGHEHNMLLFSEDGGVTWSEPCIIEECYGKWGNSPSGYNTVTETAPGILTVVYDDPKERIAQNAPDGYKRQVYAKTVKVVKESI